MEKKNNKLDKILSIAIWILLVLIFVLPDICNYHVRTNLDRDGQIYYLFFSAIVMSVNALSFIKAKRSNKIKGFGWEFSSVFTVLFVIYFFAMLAKLLIK